MKLENNKFSVVRAIPEQFIKNEYDRVKLGAFRSSINFYEERIKQLLEMKDNEKGKLEQFLKDCINSTPGIDKYKSPGAVIICENLLFFYDGEGWCPCRKADDLLTAIATNLKS